MADEGVVGSGVIFPAVAFNAKREVLATYDVQLVPDAMLGVFVLFTQPGREWKLLVDPRASDEITVELARHQIAR